MSDGQAEEKGLQRKVASPSVLQCFSLLLICHRKPLLDYYNLSENWSERESELNSCSREWKLTHQPKNRAGSGNSDNIDSKDNLCFMCVCGYFVSKPSFREK